MEKSVRPGPAALDGVQMLRGLAAVMVVAHHILEESNGVPGSFSPDWLTVAGAAGVDIFFVISGFIMVYVSFRPGRSAITAPDFMIRRVTRIYPLYWACCAVMLGVMALGFLSSHILTAGQIAASLLLLPGKEIIGVSWTLVYEMYFYLVFGLALFLRSESLVVVTTVLAITALIALSFLLPSSAISEFLANPLPLEFCAGMGLALVYKWVQASGRTWPPVWLAALPALAVIAISPLLVAHPDTHGLPDLPRVLIWGIPAVVMVAAVLSIPTTRSRLSRAAVFLGDSSYSLYLTHVFVMIGYGLILRSATVRELPQVVVTPVILLICLAVGAASHLLFEKPVEAFIRGVLARPKPEPLAQPPMISS